MVAHGIVGPITLELNDASVKLKSGGAPVGGKLGSVCVQPPGEIRYGLVSSMKTQEVFEFGSVFGMDVFVTAS